MFNPCAGCHGNVTQQVRFGSTVAYAMKFPPKMFVVLDSFGVFGATHAKFRKAPLSLSFRMASSRSRLWGFVLIFTSREAKNLTQSVQGKKKGGAGKS